MFNNSQFSICRHTYKLYSEFSELVLGMAVFEGIYSHLKNKWLQKILFGMVCLEIHHNDVAFFLTAVDEN